jgi:hypothetical protein
VCVVIGEGGIGIQRGVGWGIKTRGVRVETVSAIHNPPALNPTLNPPNPTLQAAAGHMAMCVSRGRLALFSENKLKVRLAKEAREAAVAAVELEPANDLAHHLMGRWHFEMAQINFVVRQLIKLVYGASLAPGTFADALTEYQTAVALNPGSLIHRVELGRVYLKLGRRQEAYTELARSVTLDVGDINAKLQKADAQALLDKLEREARGWAVLPLAWGSEAAGGAQEGGQPPVGGASAA